MYDTFNQHGSTTQHRSTQRDRAAPRLITKFMCLAATAQCAYVVALLFAGTGIGLRRTELIHVFIAAALGIPALYLLARDMLTAPGTRTSVKAFRVGMWVGRIHRR